MIEIFDSINIFDLLFDYVVKNNCALVYFSNKNIEDCSEEKRQAIFDFYENFLPEDLLEIIKQNNKNIIKFSSLDSAILNAAAWFPAVEYLPDVDHYWHTYVIGPDGEFEYENILPPVKPEEPAEGA